MDSMVIMIVDDEEMNREMLRFMLSKHFGNFLLATNGREGLDMLAGNKHVDLILLDLEMPVMNGREMLAAIRKSPELQSVPVIVTAGNREESILTLAEGADDFITKPYDPLELLLRVKTHIQRRIDTAERKQAESKLKFITDSAHDAIMMMDPEGTITFWNPAAANIFGYRAEEILGRNLHNILAPVRYHADHAAAFPRFILTGGGSAVGKTVDLFALRKDGREIAVELSLAAILLNGGWHSVGIVRDVTERKRIEAELVKRRDEAEAATQAKSSFLATMSHDIRTPISGVIGIADLLLNTELTEEQREYSIMIRKSGDNLLGLINDILDFSKIEAGKLELELIDFNLSSLVNDVAAMFVVQCADAGLKIESRFDPAVPAELIGDPGRVRQVITNLVGNAVKFTREGEVAIDVKFKEKQNGFVTVLFAITDTGIGIPLARQSALFSPFTQVDGSTTRKYGGTGLGLAICKQLAELMEGEIGVISEEGKGSTFWFTARFEKQTSSAGKVSIPPKADIAPRGRDMIAECAARILLVEDNAINQKVALGMLGNLGYKADIAANGSEAVQTLELCNYDLVFMDCQMPEMDGFEATSVIRDKTSRVLDHDVPIIAMTANAIKGDRERCIEVGMNDYLSKPVKKEELSAMLAKYLKPECQ